MASWYQLYCKYCIDVYGMLDCSNFFFWGGGGRKGVRNALIVLKTWVSRKKNILQNVEIFLNVTSNMKLHDNI